jgi:hypothetical protein
VIIRIASPFRIARHDLHNADGHGIVPDGLHLKIRGGAQFPWTGLILIMSLSEQADPSNTVDNRKEGQFVADLNARWFVAQSPLAQRKA